ncbi:DUF1801 domain-containing protein [Belliella sp. DSM 111904]|uniref:DUF1801 domain-containing protein n=1 Tax=Belliella filtrata TaxID=2923435 RepID=A0ABS9V1S9_9BACT|nr:DUF1801 domain-containing protein [Belliella filtrata]MCH7410382.1 DUF1801 domain-containing protein [Belliella filtrata]
MAKENKWKEELELLKSIIEQKTPLQHGIKWGGDVYMFEGKNVIGISGFKNHFGVWFFQGKFIDDHQQKFINAQEGKTSAMLQWRMTSAEDIDEKTLLNYISQSIENEKKGIKHTPQKAKKAELTGALATHMESDLVLKKAFGTLSPGKQKEYLEFINAAKKPETQQARIVKIKPLILEGKGLNDKYKK